MKSNTFWLVNALVIFSAFAASSAKANHLQLDNPPKPEGKFQHIDKNADNKITLAEFKMHKLNEQRIVHHFKQLDTDNNGVLSKRELSCGNRKVSRANKHKTCRK